ncbi:MAG TPA: signal peptide peptidase SppA [Polyangia bacterium]|jgi:protease-4
MKRVLIAILAIIGACTVALVGLGVLAVACGGAGAVPKHTILELNLDEGLVEDMPEAPFARAFGRERPSVRDVVEALARAGDDDRVAGVVARLGQGALPIAHIQELRDAIAAFRAKKKFAIAYAESFFGPSGNGTGAYYLASAFEQIWLQPSGDVGLTGIMAETPFLAGTLEKLGLKFHGDGRKEYKNAINSLTEKKFTPAHREATEKLVSSIFGQIVRGIAEGRRLGEADVRALCDRAPLLANEALQARLVDRLAYRDEVLDEAKKRAGKDAKLLYASKYLARAGRPNKKGKTIALIYGVGAINRGKSSYDPLGGDTTLGSDTVAGAFRAAIDDKDVKAILFRVDSPGGSATASDAIWRETVRAKKAGKPVIVSMSSVAGSGGYWIAMHADKIVAQPATITGSIGVFTGKLLTAGLQEKIGVSFDEVHTSQNAGIWSSNRDFSPGEWARVQAILDRIYEEFTSRVAEGRKLPKDKVLEVAKGRIWSGEDAKGLGLVDELGGFPVALRLAKQAAGIPEKDSVRLKKYPPRRPAFEALFGEEPDNSEHGDRAELSARTLDALRPVLRSVRQLGAGADERALEMPAAGVAP